MLAAVADAEQAVSDGEAIPHGSRAQVQIMAALVLLAAGDAEQAAARLAPVLGLPAELRLATFSGRLSTASALASGPPTGTAAPRGGSPSRSPATSASPPATSWPTR